MRVLMLKTRRIDGTVYHRQEIHDLPVDTARELLTGGFAALVAKEDTRAPVHNREKAVKDTYETR